MKFPGFLGPSVPARSPAITSQRTVNLFLEVDNQNGKAPLAMYGFPGLTTVLTLPNAPCEVRAEWVAEGRRFVIGGNKVYELAADFTAFERGTIGSSAGRVQMLDNGLQLGVFDSLAGWVLDLSTNIFTQIIADGFPSGTGSVTYQDGYTIAIFPDSEKFCVSGLKDMTTWDALDFASAEGLPDNLVACIDVQRVLYLLGEDSFEAWSNTGAADFPFQRIEGSFVETGCAAPQSVAKLDGGFLFLGNDARNAICVYKVGGPNSLTRVSNGPIEAEFATYTLSDAFAFGFNYQGHVFYVLTFPSNDRTWVYDITSQAWTEWLCLSGSTYTRHRSNCFAVMNGSLVVGDWQNGKLYKLDPDNYTDDGATIKALRRAAIISADENLISNARLQVVMQQGTGTQEGQGANPRLMLRVSDDGGRTWGNERTAPVGKVGQYAGRTMFWRLGQCRNRCYEVSISDPVKRVFLGAEIA